MRRGEHEFGVLNLFLSTAEMIDERTQTFLRALLDETTLGLEGVRLRRKELTALRQMQVLRQKSDFLDLIHSLLENVHRSFEADFAAMIVLQTEHAILPVNTNGQAYIDITIGEVSLPAGSVVQSIFQGVLNSSESVLLGDVFGDPESPSGLRSFMAAPLLLSEREVIGVVGAGSQSSRGFNKRQLSLLQTIAG